VTYAAILLAGNSPITPRRLTSVSLALHNGALLHHVVAAARDAQLFVDSEAPDAPPSTQSYWWDNAFALYLQGFTEVYIANSRSACSLRHGWREYTTNGRAYARVYEQHVAAIVRATTGRYGKSRTVRYRHDD